jgi:hypothetical protein
LDSGKKEASQLSFNMSAGGLVQRAGWRLRLAKGKPMDMFISLTYNSTLLAMIRGHRRLPSSLIAFISDQVNQKAVIINNFFGSLAFRITSTAPSAV